MELPPLSNYNILIIPLNYHRKFTDLTKAEIADYFKWFLSVKDDRLSHLCNFLFGEVPSDNCLDERKLNVIEMFLINSVSVIKKPESQLKEELKDIPEHFKPFVSPDNYMLDRRTISVCYDIGIYLGELIVKLEKTIRWSLEKNIDFADYGQPILERKGFKFIVNPFQVAKNAAYNIFENKYHEGDLLGYFNVWKRCFGIS